MSEILSQSSHDHRYELHIILKNKFPNISKKLERKSIELQKLIDSQSDNDSTINDIENILSKCKYTIDATKSIKNDFPIHFTQDQINEIKSGEAFLSIFENTDKKCILVIKKLHNISGGVLQSIVDKAHFITAKNRVHSEN